MFILVLLAVHVVVPQRAGTLALTQILEPYIVLSALIVAPFALIRPRLTGAVVAGILVVTVLVRYGPGWISLPPAGEPRLSVATWNIEWGPRGAERVAQGLENVTADLVGLEELQPNMASRIDADARITTEYPYRALGPEPTVLGVGLLSRFPIVEQRVSHEPPYLRAVVAWPDPDSRLLVYVVHPIRGLFDTVGGIPVGIDTVRRDAALTQIRAAIEADVEAGATVVVLGDLNTTEREPAYFEFAAGMRDAQLDVGLGPGFTWRLGKGLPFGLLRIDYVLTTPDLSATSYDVTCTELSDHCIVEADLR